MSRIAAFVWLWLSVCHFACAETLGLGFWVEAEVAQTPAQKQILEDRLARQVAELNVYFRNSLVDLNAAIVTIQYANMGSKDAVAVLEDMVTERNGFAGLFAKADEFGADYNFAVVGNLMLRGKPNCGRAYAINTTLNDIASLRRAVAVLNNACGSQTLAHELGHLFGLNHGDAIDECLPGKGHKTALKPYAQGYASGNCDKEPQLGEFGTIMVGGYMREINGNGHSSLPFFSNALLKDPRCGTKGICGDVRNADAARVLNEHAKIYVSHAEPDVHVLRYANLELADCIFNRYRFTEIEHLDELSCPDAGITTLEGIQQLTHLKRINLPNNPLSDAQPLLWFCGSQIEMIDLSDTSLPHKTVNALSNRFGEKLKINQSLPTEL